MAENTKTNKEILIERMREKYPDKTFEDEEELYGSINDDYNNYDNDVAGYKEREQGLIDMFNADPRSANFLTNWRKGSDPVIELVRLFGPELREALDDPEKLEALEAAHKKYMEKMEADKIADQEYKANLEESLKDLDSIAAELGLNEEQVQAAMEQLLSIVKDANRGIYTPQTLQLVLKAMNHDQDVATAAQEAEIAGRNQKIKENLRKPVGDGMPQLAGANNPAQQNRNAQSIFDIAAGAQ